MALVSKAEFGRMNGVSHTAVNKWQKAGWLVMQGKLVDVGASNAQLAKYRNSGDGRAKRSRGAALKPETKKHTQASSGSIEIRPGESVEQAAERLTAGIVVNMTTSVEEAKRFKEIYLVLLHQLDYEQKSGALVELSVAQEVLFEAFRAQRDAWLNWPVKVGPVIAADLGIDETDRMVEVLTTHVHKQISDLGEIAADFGSGES